MSNWKQDMILAVVLAVIALLFYTVGQNYPPNAALFPTHLAPVLFVLALWLGVSAFRKRGPQEGSFSFAKYKSVVFVAIIMVAYAMVLPFMGYIAASIVLIALFLLGLGYARRKTALCVAVGSALVIYTLFGVLLEVPLPAPMFLAQ